MYIHDTANKRVWLVDGGAFASIIPPSAAQKLKGPNNKTLTAANGTPIPCYGDASITVFIGDRAFRHTFIVADVKSSILGADFLATHYLAPNHRDQTIIDLKDLSTISFTVPSCDTQPLVNKVTIGEEHSKPYKELLNEYPSLSKPNFKLADVDHGVTHRIPTTGHPVQSKARRLSPEKLAAAKAQLDQYVELGVARRSKSDWSSPLMCAPKPDGTLRICGDYRRLNCQTEDDRYPVKNLMDFNSDLQGKTIFSKVDLLKGYHQIPVNEEDIRKTAVITPFGMYEFPRTPFGLKTAGQSFQRLMDTILNDIPHVFVYIDDVLVASSSPQEHLEDLERLFKRLEENGLVVNVHKCVFGQSSLDFLGYHVDAAGIHPMEDRVKAIKEMVSPTSVKELQRFLGMVNYYRRFVPRAAHHMFHLFEALRDKPKKLVWTPECQASFQAIKEALSHQTLLHHPRHGAHLAVTTDASKVAVGATLEQRGPKGWEPLAYFSKKLSTEHPNQTEWPPFDRELLGIFKGVRHFRPMIEGRPFTIYTDQQALVPALHKKTEPLTARQTYQLSCIAELSTDIRYIQGKSNFAADALSRPNGLDVSAVARIEPHIFAVLISDNKLVDHPRGPEGKPFETSPWVLSRTTRDALPARPGPRKTVSFADSRANHNNSTALIPSHSSNPAAQRQDDLSQPKTPISHIDRPVEASKSKELDTLVGAIEPLGVDLVEMALEQPMDADFLRLSKDPSSGLSFRSVDLGQQSLLVDVSNGTPRPFVPFSWRRRVFNAVHGLGHPGVHRTQQMMSGRFVWPSIGADSARWARECVSCQRAKVTRHVTPPIGNFEVPERRFSHLNVDIVTLPSSNGYTHLLTVVDRFTRWPAAFPIKDMSAETVIDAFAQGWIANYGVPTAVTTDRGSQFMSSLWTQMLTQWGVKALATTAYHPQANGLVERLHRRLKEALLALCPDSPELWYWKLPMALLAVRTTLKPDLGASPADLVFGEGLALPGDLLQTAAPLSDDLQQQRAATLAKLRVEVARLQPTPTSAHRTPQIFLPAELQHSTHVFVRRGGVQPSLSTPYEGPYRIASKSESGFRVHLPGGRVERIALERLKPAHVSADDGSDPEPQDLEDHRPPSPRPCGRPPGPRTRMPQPTTRITRQQTRAAQQTPNPSAPNTTTSDMVNFRSSGRPVAPSRRDKVGNKQHRRKTKNIDEYNTNASAPAAAAAAPDDDDDDNAGDNTDAGANPAWPRVSLHRLQDLRKDIPSGIQTDIPPEVTSPNVLDFDPGADARFNPQPDGPPSAPPTSTTAPVPPENLNQQQHTPVAPPPQAPETIEDEEPMRDAGFFAPMTAAPTTTAPTQPPTLPSTPATPRRYFSDQRDGATTTHSFSRHGRTVSRPRPNLSAIFSLINSHLKSED